MALILHVVYKGRALPVAWQVRQGKQGHFPEDRHIALVKQVQTLIPCGASVVLLGDGACDGTTLQRTLQDADWSSVVRTGSNSTVLWDGERFRCETVAAGIKPGTLVALTDGHVTAAAYGPVMLLCCWAKGYPEPLHLLTNLASADEACRLYAKRFRIATFFSDQKSRGCHLHRSHLAEPLRLSRLLMAACFAYIWIIYLGALCEHDGWGRMIHRGNRCDRIIWQMSSSLAGGTATFGWATSIVLLAMMILLGLGWSGMIVCGVLHAGFLHCYWGFLQFWNKKQRCVVTSCI